MADMSSSDETSVDSSLSDSEEEKITESMYNSYWSSLKGGVLAYPASLFVQCLLFIIGHLHEFPLSAVGLLSSTVRRKVLLHLPAIDVLKLEGTPLTANLLMDEIWRSLYNLRMPLSDFKFDVLEAKEASSTALSTLKKKWNLLVSIDIHVGTLDIVHSCTPTEFNKKFGILYNWKEAYLHVVLFSTYGRIWNWFNTCKSCSCRHYDYDLFYGVYDAKSILDIYRCFDINKTKGVHNVHRCVLKCPRLTTTYVDKFPTAQEIFCTGYKPLCFHDLVQLRHHLPCSPFKFYVLSENSLQCGCKEDWSHDDLKWLFASVEGIALLRCKDSDKLKLRNILSIVFSSESTISKIFIRGMFEEIVPYLVEGNSNCNLKSLHLYISKPSDGQIADRILDYHKELEEVYINTTYEVGNEASTVICDLFFRPYLKRLSLAFDLVSNCKLHLILHRFFTSPYPVALEVIDASDSSDFPVNEFSNPFIDGNLEKFSKSLSFSNCNFDFNSSISSFFPSKLHLVNFELSHCRGIVYELFANMESIEVNETFLFTHDYVIEDNVSVVYSLFKIVTAQHWKVHVSFDNQPNTLDMFTNALSSIRGSLDRLEISYLKYKSDLIKYFFVALLEVVFNRLSLEEVPYFELAITNTKIDEEMLKGVHSAWERCGSPKLKSIVINSNKLLSKSVAENILSQIAIKYTCY